MAIETRYLDGSYLAENPTWDSQDAIWKAARVASILRSTPASICDVGCGSGDVLAQLAKRFPDTRMTGFDISPQLTSFWARHPGIDFRVGDLSKNTETFDVLLMLDVFEHVRDPFSFLEQAHKHAKQFVFHIPLDLSALAVGRGTPLMHSRRSVGHLHFYTKELALQTLVDSGYVIDDARYTDAATLTTHHTWRTKLAALPRKLAYAIHKDAGVRILGGETLIVLAH